MRLELTPRAEVSQAARVLAPVAAFLTAFLLAGVVVWLIGVIGGALYGLIPALLRVRFGVSEILSSLMLVYVAQLVLDYLARGPWRDPKGMNFPQSVPFDPAATLPPILSEGRLHLGALFALVAVAATAFVLGRTFIGGESAQILLKLPLDLTTAFQGLLLLCVLGADALVSYRLRLVARGGGA